MVFFFQAEDGIRDLVRSRGLGDVYKRQVHTRFASFAQAHSLRMLVLLATLLVSSIAAMAQTCLLYTSDAADERSSVDLGGRRIIKKKTRLQLVLIATCSLDKAEAANDRHT